MVLTSPPCTAATAWFYCQKLQITIPVTRFHHCRTKTPYALIPNMETTTTAYLGIGANLGDRLEALRDARAALQKEPAVTVVASAPLYETAAVGGPEGQPPYLNSVLKIATVYSPERLLELCHQVEKEFGRQRHERWGPRTLDIDLLFFGAQIRMDIDLVLPHPRLHEREFVLAPLVDLAPDLIHPVVFLSVEELLLRLDSPQGVQRVAELW